MMVSVIIPVYNEANTIIDCLSSLATQRLASMEIIVVDDGSTDDTKSKINQAKSLFTNNNLTLLEQSHKGPAKARNFGATKAKGEILVFVDADMIFDKDFIKRLITPIISKNSQGTFTKEEYVSNWENSWARCWNYNNGISTSRRIPADYPDQSPVFRAILKSEFVSVGGFDDIGFTDDWTLSRKLGFKATLATGAICYHTNPDSLKEVYSQARWIGKNEFISGSTFRKMVNICRYNPVIALLKGIALSLKYKELKCIIFTSVYDCAILQSIILSFVKEAKSK